MNIEIPAGLTDLLQEFTINVLREKPADLVEFAANYFRVLNENRKCGCQSKKEVSFGGGRDEDMQVESDDDEPSAPPSKLQARRKSVSAERYDPEADDDGDEPKVCHPKTDEQRKRLSEATKDILIFRALDQEQMQEIIDAMFEKRVEPGEHVIDQGDDGDNFYVIDSGTYDIYVNQSEGPAKVGSYDNKGSFGELALMYNLPRAATIIATSNGTLWAMDRTTFRRIVLKTAFNKRKMYENLLENVPLLKELDPYERMNIADALVPKKFEDGEQIIRQGDSADYMYFIEDGEVSIKMSQKNESEEVEVAYLRKGQYFGELALVTHKPRAASAYAVGTAKCAVLDIGAFERLLGPCMEIMKRNIDNYEDQLVSVFGDKANISDLR